MEADKEGFLRAERALIQTIGRAARNAGGQVIMYADRMTDSMAKAVGETDRRRTKQLAYNLENDITPTTIVKETGNSILESLRGKPDALNYEQDDFLSGSLSRGQTEKETSGKKVNMPLLIKKLEKEMKAAAKNLDFERAGEIRDQLKVIQERVAKNRQL
jgi:excinuclease ABC subunit B